MSTAGNPSYKPSEGKREEFRKYLEKNGVMDALTKVLVNLYEEVDKPEDALEYIRDKLAVIAGIETHKQLQQKLTDADERIKELEGQLETGAGEVEPEPTVEGDDAQQLAVEEQPLDAGADQPPAEDLPPPQENPNYE